MDACVSCLTCEGRVPATSPTDEDKELAKRIERLVQERDGGCPLDFSELTPLEWELVSIWDASVNEQKRAAEERMRILYEAMVARLGT